MSGGARDQLRVDWDGVRHMRAQDAGGGGEQALGPQAGYVGAKLLGVQVVGVTRVVVGVIGMATSKRSLCRPNARQTSSESGPVSVP